MRQWKPPTIRLSVEDSWYIISCSIESDNGGSVRVIVLSVFVIFQTQLATGRAIHGHRPRFQMAYRGQLTRILRTALRGSISSPTANSTNTDICFVDAALDFGFVDGVGVSKACAIYGSVVAACRSVPQRSALLLSRPISKRWFRVFVV